MPRNKIFKGGLVLSAGGIFGTVALFARNIAIARLISVEDFGIAATFAMTMALIEMSNNIAIDRFIIQSEDGDKPEVQSTIQAFQVVRGFLNSVVLFFAASLIADFFNIPEVTWAYQVISIVPFIAGFAHLDPIRAQRRLNFMPTTVADLIPKILTVAAVIPLAFYLEDYTIMLWLIILQAILATALTHAFSKRTYSWSVSKVILKQMFHFGWPLLLNGILIFLIFQGDRMIVGRFFAMENLGWYGAAYTLTMVPAVTVARIVRTLVMPVLASAKTDLDLLTKRYLAVFQFCLLIGLVAAVYYLISGPSLFVFLYGQNYAAGANVIIWLGLMQVVRIMRVGPSTAAIALGKTKIPLQSNLLRSLALVFAIILILQDYSITSIAISAFLGELGALLYSLFLLRKHSNLPVWNAYPPMVLMSLFAVTFLMFKDQLISSTEPILHLLYATATAGVLGIIMVLISPQLIHDKLIQSKYKRILTFFSEKFR